MSNRAQIGIGVTGADKAQQDLRGVSKALTGVANAAHWLDKSGGSEGDKGKVYTAQSVAAGALREVLKGAYHAAVDFSRAAADIKPINFRAAAERAKEYEDSVTRLAVRSGQQVDVLRNRFVQAGKEIGATPERVAAAARAWQKGTGVEASAETLKALGDEANDTDRSLEEMTEIGQDLYQKLGTPITRIAGDFLKLRDIARDFSVVGGHAAIEDTLKRLAPQMAGFGGGTRHHGAIVAAIGAGGKSQEVAQQEAAAIYGAFNGADKLLITKALRAETKDQNYKPYYRDPLTGRMTLKEEALPLLQQHFHRAPGGQAAASRFFGNDIGAADTFWNLNFKQVEQSEFGEPGQRAKALGLPAERRAMFLNRPLTEGDKRELATITKGLTGGESAFSQTTAGQRAMVRAEKAEVELDTGATVAKLQDRRNASYRGRRGLQAALDTSLQYLPSQVGDIVVLGETAQAATQQALLANEAKPATPPTKIGLDEATMNRLERTLNDRAPPSLGPAAQAVENNKSVSRSLAN